MFPKIRKTNLSLLEELSFIFRDRKLVVAFFVFVGLVVFWIWLKKAYLDEALYDKSRKVHVNSREVSWIEVGAGDWVWKESRSKFSQFTQFEINDRHEIDSFCRLVSSSPAIYIPGPRFDFGVDILIRFYDSRPLKIRAGRNHQKQYFFIHGDHTYEALWLPMLIRKWFERYATQRLGPPDPRYPY